MKEKRAKIRGSSFFNGSWLEDVLLMFEWLQNLCRLALEDFDAHVTVGMDGKKVQMGFNQGGEAVEHLVVNAQGVSGLRSLGIYQEADLKGKLTLHAILFIRTSKFCPRLEKR